MAPGGNRLSWWQQIPHFAARHTVLTFDHRGFGRSACAREDLHPRHFAGDLLAILDAAGIESAAPVCQSLGGWTGLRTARERPDRVRCLVLAGTPGGIATQGILGAAAELTGRVAQEGIRGNAALAPDFPRRRPDMAHLYAQISGLNTAFEPGLLPRLLEPGVRIAPDAVADFRTPTLVLAGEEDQLFPLEALREIAGLLSAEFRAFPGIGHSIYFEAPEAFNQTVRDFVAKHL